jgi:DNA primase
VAGRIRAEDIAAVKERTLDRRRRPRPRDPAPAGVGAMKGLCPFHDEKTPSFTVRESAGTYHCFGCGEGGDVVSFVQKVDHLTFTEAVERLAGRLGMELRREEGGPVARDGGRAPGLVEAHRVAQEFYADRARRQPEARRPGLPAERGFDGRRAERFGVGFAPRRRGTRPAACGPRASPRTRCARPGWSGAVAGLYDRFRGRLMWPIRDTSGDTIGFGARRIFDDDRIEAKYLNTTETPIYKKSTVLYGLDLAKKAISGGGGRSSSRATPT